MAERKHKFFGDLADSSVRMKSVIPENTLSTTIQINIIGVPVEMFQQMCKDAQELAQKDFGLTISHSKIFNLMFGEMYDDWFYSQMSFVFAEAAKQKVEAILNEVGDKLKRK